MDEAASLLNTLLMMVIAILPKELGVVTGVVQLFLVGVQTITVFGEILNFSKVLTKVCCCCPRSNWPSTDENDIVIVLCYYLR